MIDSNLRKENVSQTRNSPSPVSRSPFLDIQPPPRGRSLSHSHVRVIIDEPIVEINLSSIVSSHSDKTLNNISPVPKKTPKAYTPADKSREIPLSRTSDTIQSKPTSNISTRTYANIEPELDLSIDGGDEIIEINGVKINTKKSCREIEKLLESHPLDTDAPNTASTPMNQLQQQLSVISVASSGSSNPVSVTNSNSNGQFYSQSSSMSSDTSKSPLSTTSASESYRFRDEDSLYLTTEYNNTNNNDNRKPNTNTSLTCKKGDRVRNCEVFIPDPALILLKNNKAKSEKDRMSRSMSPTDLVEPKPQQIFAKRNSNFEQHIPMLITPPQVKLLLCPGTVDSVSSSRSRSNLDEFRAASPYKSHSPCSFETLKLEKSNSQADLELILTTPLVSPSHKKRLELPRQNTRKTSVDANMFLKTPDKDDAKIKRSLRNFSLKLEKSSFVSEHEKEGNFVKANTKDDANFGKLEVNKYKSFYRIFLKCYLFDLWLDMVQK